MRKALGWIVVACMCVSTITLAQQRPVNPVLGPVPVLDVLDGDTVLLESNLGPRVVRLIGIDTPEVQHPEKGREPFGLEASAFTKQTLPPGTEVFVEIDLEAEDAYSRLLAYLYLEDPAGDWDVDGQRASMVNLTIAQGGWARVLTIEPNAVYADLFEEAVEGARRARFGMWGPHLPRTEANDIDPIATDTATVSGGGPTKSITLTCVLFDPREGGREVVTVTLHAPLDLRGYYLHDADGSKTRLPLPAGEHPPGRLEIVNEGQEVWNNGGDTIYLKYGSGGDVIDAWDYRDVGRESSEGDVICRDGTINPR